MNVFYDEINIVENFINNYPGQVTFTKHILKVKK